MATAAEVMEPFVDVSAINVGDKVLLQAVVTTTDGTTTTTTIEPARITVEVLRAYLVQGIQPSVNAQGYLCFGGVSTGVKAEGITPQLRRGTFGVECSTDGGTTWTTVALWNDISGEVWLTQDEYNALVDAGTVNANITYNIYEE